MRIDLEQHFDRETIVFIRAIGAFAEEQGLELALVGGPVRDLLLGIPVRDLDFLVEGEAIEFVEALFLRWSTVMPDFSVPRTPVSFPKYRTAKLMFSDTQDFLGPVVDFASTRKEIYPESGKPPIVSPSDLQSDLARRDFSINAMALRLGREFFGEVLDPHNGIEDLAAKQLRVLHDKSFIDDPARMIRGVRFHVRFGFAWEAHSEKLFVEAREDSALRQLPAVRLFDEFRKALCEKEACRVVAGLEQRGLLAQIHPELAFSTEYQSRFSKQPLEWEVQFVLLLAKSSTEQFEEVLRHFGIRGKKHRQLMRLKEELEKS